MHRLRVVSEGLFLEVFLGICQVVLRLGRDHRDLMLRNCGRKAVYSEHEAYGSPELEAIAKGQIGKMLPNPLWHRWNHLTFDVA